jgi:addiction module HigA family antidote
MGATMMEDKLNPIHPGEVLQEEFLKPLGLSQNRLALAIGVPARRINEIVLGRRGITADTALRLARFFGNSPQFWLGLQADYDIDVTRSALGSRLVRDVRPYASLREGEPEYEV